MDQQAHRMWWGRRQELEAWGLRQRVRQGLVNMVSKKNEMLCNCGVRYGIYQTHARYTLVYPSIPKYTTTRVGVPKGICCPHDESCIV